MRILVRDATSGPRPVWIEFAVESWRFKKYEGEID
jgi:hypothetical protein